MLNISYKKRENRLLFQDFKKEDENIKEIQNYSPIYNAFFEFNNNNWKHVVFNHENYIQKVLKKTSKNEYTVQLLDDSITTCFVKQSPVIDHIYYLTGKYQLFQDINEKLVTYEKKSKLDKMNSIHNTAYIDFVFYFLTSKLSSINKFPHACTFYDSFQTIYNNYEIDVSEDIDVIENSEYFHNHYNSLFSLVNEEYHQQYITQTKSVKPCIHIQKTMKTTQGDSIPDYIHDTFCSSTQSVALDSSANSMQEVFSISLDKNNSDDESTNDSEYNSDDAAADSCTDSDSKSDDESEENSNDESDSDSDSDSSTEYIDHVDVRIKTFPVQMICIEKLQDTLDNYINTNENISDYEWISILIQIIMTLATYNKVFDFTHNDLHTENIMYTSTEEKTITYKFNDEYYTIPTYGKLYKIIDYGRSIFRYKNVQFCSDSYDLKHGDASLLYNFEPFYTSKKERIEPNPSFDLCRLACSLYDHFLEKHTDIYDNEIFQFIHNMCLDDNGIHMLYKNKKHIITRKERYSGFLLYKKIVKTVHNQTPKIVLNNVIFECIKSKTYKLQSQSLFVDIDSIPPNFVQN